jgi:hypothetical protein
MAIERCPERSSRTCSSRRRSIMFRRKAMNTSAVLTNTATPQASRPARMLGRSKLFMAGGLSYG